MRVRSVAWGLREGEVGLDVSGFGDVLVPTRLIGPHNAVNVAGGVALGRALELDPGETVAACAECLPVPGRLEPVDAGQRFPALVDYAHNPAGVEAVLATAAALREGGGSLIVVLSAPVTGEREQRDMGRRAAELADRLILTTERFLKNAPTDPPDPLLRGVRGGAARVEIEPSRADAIRSAVDAAGPGDVVLVLGRGELAGPLYEPGADEPQPFDDRERLRGALGDRSAG